mgnify:FL=1
MKLFLLRHAKTKQFSGSGADFDRKLKEKGEKQLVLMNAHLRKYFPDVEAQILLSTAKRTQQTFKRLSQNLENCSCTLDADLYLADLSIHLHKIAQVKSKQDILIIGHNYGISETATYFLDTPITLPTCGLVVLDFEIDSWDEAFRGNATLYHQFYPQVLD